MKLNEEKLKNIIKECISEVLLEKNMSSKHDLSVTKSSLQEKYMIPLPPKVPAHELLSGFIKHFKKVGAFQRPSTSKILEALRLSNVRIPVNTVVSLEQIVGWINDDIKMQGATPVEKQPFTGLFDIKFFIKVIKEDIEKDGGRCSSLRCYIMTDVPEMNSSFDFYYYDTIWGGSYF